MIKKLTAFVILFLISLLFGNSYAQHIEVYPSNWWVGMKWNKVQLMLYGENVGYCNGVTIKYPGVSVAKINKVENKNYLFVDIIIS
ncbi:MAG TPA: cyclomaltodextrinase N-terminal domain-containing protein, partial [Saprospiraceae bacterium]|nr:cyclomaltodextrinase N-terminal domain-containing protein [Saprospiraceae bacterium]